MLFSWGIHPVLSGSLSLVNPYNLQIKGNYIYIADGTGGFKVVDISNPGTPVLKASLPTHDTAVDVYIDGNNAYVAEQVAGITVIDISNPLSPVETDSTAGQPRPSPFPTETPIPPTEPTPTPYPTSTPAVTPDINIWGAMNLVVKDTNIVLGNNISPEIKIVTAGSLEVVNLLDTYLDVDYDAVMNGFDLEGNYLYLVQENNLFRIIDITDSLHPLVADGLVLGSNVKGNGLVVNFPYVFASSGAIEIINISNPDDVVEAGCISIPGKAGGVAFEGGYIYIPGRHTNYELIIIRTNLQ
ncbi:MAG: hypothetical protein JXB88_07175 [Spirochaetales bacterium]|nr:hypothetical protein [Spirochaetales bacterium]